MRGFFLTALVQSILAGCACFYDADGFAVKWTTYFKNHLTVCFGKQCVITTHADIYTCVEFCAALTYQDVAGQYCLTAEFFSVRFWYYRLLSYVPLFNILYAEMPVTSISV